MRRYVHLSAGSVLAAILAGLFGLLGLGALQPVYASPIRPGGTEPAAAEIECLFDTAMAHYRQRDPAPYHELLLTLLKSRRKMVLQVELVLQVAEVAGG